LPSSWRQHFPVHATIQFHPDEAVDTLEFHRHAFHAESYKLCQIEWERHLPALMKKAVVLDVVVVKIIGERVKPVSIVSALKKNCGRDQTAQPSIAIVERMYGGKEKVGHQAVDYRRKTAQMVAVDESNVSIHQPWESLGRRARVKAANRRSSYLNAQSPQRAFIVVHTGLIRYHSVH